MVHTRFARAAVVVLTIVWGVGWSIAFGQETTGRKAAGRVVDGEGKAVGGAEVYLVRSAGYEVPVVEKTKADGQGRFELNVPEGADSMYHPFEVHAYVPGKGVGEERFNSKAETVVELKGTTRISLTMLAADGKPVAGMKVYPEAFAPASISFAPGQVRKFFFMRPPRAICEALAGMTDEKGKVTLGDLPRGTRMEVGFDDERFARQGLWERVALSENGAQSEPVTVKLEAGATVSGVVRFGTTGSPAAGIVVMAQPTNRSMDRAGGMGVTDAGGMYHIAHLGAGEYNVMLLLDKSQQKDWAAAAHEWVKVEGGKNVGGLDISLVKGGIIKGKVITADTAEPVAGSEVGVQGPAHPQSSGSIQSTETGADGTYSIRVPPGRLQRREGEAVNGVVVGLDGKPAKDVVVQAQAGMSPMLFPTAKTDAEGRFHFEGLPVGAGIVVKSGDVCTGEPVLVGKGPGEVRLQLVRRVKLGVRGLITDEEGKPIAGARVRLSQSFGDFGMGEGEPRITGADGTYDIKDLYVDNQYEIAADAEGFGEKQAKLELAPGVKELPTLKLPRASARTGGVVVDETGKPVAGVTVHLNNGMSPTTCVTDVEGKFSFQVVPGASHMIWIAVKERGKVGPNVMGSGGMNDLKLVLPKSEQ